MRTTKRWKEHEHGHGPTDTRPGDIQGLQVGDIVRHVNHASAFVVINEGPPAVVARTMTVRNPSEWIVIRKGSTRYLYVEEE